jgi:hypothetical protein
VPIVPLLAYNLVTFGRLQPYDMPRSTRRWTVNVADYALAQLDELGFPAALAAQPACAIILVALIATALAAAFWRLRRAPARQGLVVLLGGYSAAGALLLVASRSRYEWGNFIDNRNVLQYTFAYALGLAVAADAVAGPRLKRAAAALGVVLLASLVVSAVKDSLAARAYHEETWLTLSRDRALMAAVRALPPDALVASNTALVFRIGVPRPVRELEVGGDDRDFRGSLGQLARAAAGRRPAAFVLVCDEWTRQFSACGGPSAPPPALPTCQLLRSEWPRAFLCEVPAAGSAPQP